MPRKPKTPGWEHYFPFARGHSFQVVLERPRLPLRGRGTVVKRTSRALRLRLEVPGGFLVPRIAADLQLLFAQEGGGNGGSLEVKVGSRRESFVDEDVAIHSSPARRTREISPSLPHRGKSGQAVLHATGDGGCRISSQGWEVRLDPL
ncbi:MAG TPA: hypothetical protein VND93_34405 [Myxococcales bacterium]|nr:hypothetical protein [Myxococcales bacterium]